MQAKKEHSSIAVTVIISAVFIFILSTPQLSAEPYVYYHLDGDGTDASGNGLDLVVNEEQVTWTEGINGQAAFIKRGDESNFKPLSMEELYGIGDWTFEAWVKLESLDDYIMLMMPGPFYLDVKNEVVWFYFYPVIPTLNYQLSYSFFGRWFHIAAIYRYGKSIQLYINGEKVAEEAVSEKVNFFTNNKLTIGTGYPCRDGFTIDEVVIHNTALSPEDFIGMQYYVEQPVYAINGHITDSSSGEGLPGTVVTAEPGEFAVATDSNGEYTIELPWDGEYSVTVHKTNYITNKQEGVVVTGDIPVTVNIALERFSSSPTIACYHFDGDGTDASGNGYDLIVNEHVTWTDGIQSKAAVFDTTLGITFEACINGLIYPGIGDFTLEGFVYIYDTESKVADFYLGNSSYGLNFIKDYRTVVRQIEFYLRNYDEYLILSLPFTDYLNKWVHVAAVYRYQQGLQIYINGALVAEKETDFVPDIFPREKFIIDSSIAGKYFIDEVRISSTALSPEEFLFTPTVVEDSTGPTNFAITGNYPNPFNPTTTIKFTIPETGFVNLNVYNITGQKIRELVADIMTAGSHSVMWDGKDENGMMVSSGIYLSRLTSGVHVAAGRMLLMK